MSTTVQNIVQKHTSVGAKKVQKDTEAIGKAQTRLGQASASAGRQFSAQATGLGGIVSAYAGAAANIFALTAAFFALQRSAEFEQIISGTERLASTIGESGQEILNTVQAITKSQLSLVEAAQNVNLGLSAGFNSSQIEELSEVSLRASKALGRNLSDAFQRVVRGAAKLEPELLDELGIFTRIDPAVRKFADSLGVSVTSLSNFERRQAFVNAVIEEGQRKFRDIDTSTDTSAQSLSKLSATIVDLGLQLGGFLANSLGPFVDFISNNTSNAIALFGLLARVVGAQAINVFGAAIKEVSGAIVAFSEKTASGLNRLNRDFKTATRAAQEFANSNTLLTRFGTAAERVIKEQARAQIELVKSGQILTRTQIQLAQSTLKEALAAELAIQARVKGQRSQEQATLAVANLRQQLTLLDTAHKKASVSANVFSLAVGGIGKVIGIAGAGLSRFLSIITTVTLALSLFQLAADAIGKIFGFEDIDILQNLVSLFKKLVDALKGAAPQIKGFANAFSEEIGKAFENTLLSEKEVKSQIEKIEKVIKKRIGGGGTTRIGNLLGELGPEAREAFEIINAEITRLEQTIGKDLTTNLIKNFKTIGDTFSLSNKQLRDALSNTDAKFGIIVNSSGELEANIGNVAMVVGKLGKDGFEPLNSALGRTAKAFVDIARLTKQFREDFKAGALNAEKADAGIQSQLNALQRIVEESEKLRKSGDQILIAKGIDLAGDAEKLRILILQQKIQARALKDQEKQNKLFEKVFGRPQEKLEQLQLRGEIDAGGEVARTSREKDLNQAKVLLSFINNRRDIQRDLGLRVGDELKTRDRIVKRLKEITYLENQNLKTGRDSSNLVKQRIALSNELKDVNKDIGDLNSLQQAQTQKANDAVAQLLILRNQLEKTIEKELRTLEKQSDTLTNNILQTTLKIKDIEIKERLEVEKAITKELLAQNNLQEKFLKDIGGLSRKEELDFLKQRVKIEKDVAKAQKDAQQELALNAFSRTQAQQGLAEKNADAQLKLQAIDIDATIKLIEIINNNSKELNANTAAILKRPPNFVSADIKGLKDRVQGGQSEFKKLQDQIRENTTKYYNQLGVLNADEYSLKYKNAERIFLAEKNVQDRRLADALERDKLSVRLFTRFNKVLTSSVTQGLDDLFDAIAAGELTLKSFREGFNAFLFNLLNDIRKQFLRETLTQPLTEFGTGILRNLFSISGPAPKLGIPSDMGALAGGNLGVAASGGSIRHMAAGGITRDRVPALLEPGEFVMKRSAARSIGEANLQSMNSTGTAGNVAVNIINQGTPQESEQASQPRFDGEKFVIDIVTRDLRNNGPIRKSLRGAS